MEIAAFVVQAGRLRHHRLHRFAQSGLRQAAQPVIGCVVFVCGVCGCVCVCVCVCVCSIVRETADEHTLSLITQLQVHACRSLAGKAAKGRVGGMTAAPNSCKLPAMADLLKHTRRFGVMELVVAPHQRTQVGCPSLRR